LNFQTFGNESILNKNANYENLGSMISARIHDQHDTYLCWVYSFSSSTKSSLKKFIKELNLSPVQRRRCFSRLNSDEFHHTLRNEVCMVIPTNYKKKGEHQAMQLRPVMIRVS